MTKILHYSVIIGALGFIVLGLLPVQLARGNLVPAPNSSSYVGTEFDGDNITFKCALVTLDVYATHTEGTGTYLIENLANTNNTLKVVFIGWYREVNVTAIKINQSFISFDTVSLCSGSCSHEYNVEFQMDFAPHATEVLQIWWDFDSYDSHDAYYDFPVHEQWESYDTGYLSTNWGSNPIEWEEVRFNFHTDAFYTSGENISVWHDTITLHGNEESVQLPRDPSGVPYYLYHAEDINSSTYLSIRNTSYLRTQDVSAITLLIVATGCAIGLPWVVAKKARKYAVQLAMMGLVSFLLFVGIPFQNFFVWGMIVLSLYSAGDFAIVSKYYLRRRAITEAGTTRLRALAHQRFYKDIYPGAIDAYQESLALNAHDFSTQTHLAHAYFRLGKEAKARDACVKALAAPPIDAACVKLLRSLCQLLGVESTPLTPVALLQTGARLFSHCRVKFAREVFFAAYEATIPDSDLEAEALRCLNKCAERNGILINSGVKRWASRLLVGLVVAGGSFAVLNWSVKISSSSGFMNGLGFLISILALICIIVKYLLGSRQHL